MIKGVHTMLYTSEPEALREFFRDEADLGCHPTEIHGEQTVPSGTAHISFYCDDIEATVAELEAKGVELDGIEDHGYGLVTKLKAPGGFEIQLYQPKYELSPRT